MAVTSEAVTQQIRVQVRSEYVPGRSKPDSQLWFFAYHITIENLGERTVQLLNRHWVITDGEGKVQEVRGPGVVGEQPTLPPGESFSYISACPLPTPVGTMHGSYEMTTEEGELFDVEIAPFTLLGGAAELH